jgi:hypothetical protein
MSSGGATRAYRMVYRAFDVIRIALARKGAAGLAAATTGVV